MDMAWLWRWEESIHDIMYSTLRNQLNYMDKYPGYTFSQDQAVVLDSMEHYYPDIFKGLVAKAQTGSFIPITSTWVQEDESVVDGESLVRQFLYGQKYTKEKFGHYVRVAWQPDVFGHLPSMPQIAQKSGVDFFLFGRPDDTVRPPISWWQGLDGSRVIAYYPPGFYTQRIDHHITPMVVETADRVAVKNLLVLFGTGDHGGGPNPDDIAGIATLNSSPNEVNVKPTNISDYVDLLLKEKNDFKVITNEMPIFTGCYTSQVEMKRNNRRAEQLLLDAEKMSEIATFFNYQSYVATRDYKEAWKLVLLNQAHDLAGGTGIGPIYVDAAKQYDEVFERGNRALGFSLERLGMQVNTLGAGVPVVIYNAQSWNRSDLVTADISGYSIPSKMVAVHGDEVIPVQVIKRSGASGARQTATIAFVGQNVPQMGLKLYHIVPETEAQKAPASAVRSGKSPRPYLENEFLRVEIDPETGNIARVFDKQNQRETLNKDGASLIALEDSRDKGKESGSSAFNLGLTGVSWKLDKPVRLELMEQGPVRATVRIVHRFRDSEFTQDVSLTAGVPRVDVSMTTDWHERATLLKAMFPLNVSSKNESAEIPYGAIERNQSGEERVMGRWVDISAADYGVAILNNGRYGYDAKDNVIRLSVVRGPRQPDPRDNEGSHTFSYSIYPHQHGWREGNVFKQALGFNSPLMALQEPLHAEGLDGLPDSYSFIKVNSDHVVLYAMKQMEGFYDKDPILRFYETDGKEGDVTVEFPKAVSAIETNMLEDTIEGASDKGTTIHFHIKPWEIKTFRLGREGWK